MTKCGCEVEQRTAECGHPYFTVADDRCILEEAVALVIKLMNRVKYWESGLGGDGLHSEAKAFLAKVEGKP